MRVPIPPRRARVARTERFDRPAFQAYRYETKSGARFSPKRTLQVVRDRLDHVPAGQTVWIRMRGGGDKGTYRRNAWWSTPPLDADELADMDDDDLLDLLNVTDPWDIDIANTR